MTPIDDLETGSTYRVTLASRVCDFHFTGRFGRLVNLGRGLPLQLEFFVSEINGCVLPCRDRRWFPAGEVSCIEAIESHERKRT